MQFRKLTKVESDQLKSQGCTADDWSKVSIHPDCDCSRIVRTRFLGPVTVGSNSGSVRIDGSEFPCGLYDVVLANCSLGNGVRIAAVGTLVSNYAIGDSVVIQNVACLTAESGASFGNGKELDVVNEGGGRGTKILDDLTSQTAYLQAMLRHDAKLTGRLSSLIDEHLAAKKRERGTVGERASILHCGTIRNVCVGPFARVQGVQSLEDGTVLSCKEHPTEVGAGVSAHHFILSEGARVDGGAMLDKAFVGQGVKLGKQFSAENSVFFANAEGFHGEAVSVFGGPYTVTHHKSTLLIAGIFSFYNAGSGTNQSNHMYKLGPVHQGVFERGCKTGSFSYVLMESHIGAFSVVIGKHFSNIQTPNLPFSYINEEAGTSKLLPGMNLLSVGTVRDGEKWPKRDNRKAPNKRDLITFDVFSPYTLEKMRCGRDELLRISESVSKEKEVVAYGGLNISRLLLRKGAKYYTMAIGRTLNEKICNRLVDGLKQGLPWDKATAALKSRKSLASPLEWTDLAGLLTPRERVRSLIDRVKSGAIRTYDALLAELRSMHESYGDDEWEYLCAVWSPEYGYAPPQITPKQALDAVALWKQHAGSLLSSVIEDAKREFGPGSRIGYGLDGTDEDKNGDFTAVRGTIESNSVVKKLQEDLASIEQRSAEMTTLFEGASKTAKS